MAQNEPRAPRGDDDILTTDPQTSDKEGQVTSTEAHARVWDVQSVIDDLDHRMMKRLLLNNVEGPEVEVLDE